MDIYRSGINTASAVGVQAIDTVIIPDDGEGLKVHGLEFTSDLAVAGRIQGLIQKSTDGGANFTTVFLGQTNVPFQTVDISDQRYIYADQARQARGSQALQYRLGNVNTAGAGNVSSSSLRGRTER
jgi:hypothetical protein